MVKTKRFSKDYTGQPRCLPRTSRMSSAKSLTMPSNSNAYGSTARAIATQIFQTQTSTPATKSGRKRSSSSTDSPNKRQKQSESTGDDTVVMTSSATKNARKRSASSTDSPNKRQKKSESAGDDTVMMTDSLLEDDAKGVSSSSDTNASDSFEALFPQFSKLPIELRRQVWKEALLPPRAVQLHRAKTDTHEDDKLIPALLHVNQEARDVALEHYVILSHHLRHQTYLNRRFVRCIDPVRDSISVNALPFYFTTSKEFVGKLIELGKGKLKAVKHLKVEMASNIMTKEFAKTMTANKGKWNLFDLFHGLETVKLVGIRKTYLDEEGNVREVKRLYRTIAGTQITDIITKFTEFIDQKVKARHEDYEMPTLSFSQEEGHTTMENLMLFKAFLS